MYLYLNHVASEANNLDIVNSLIKAGANVNDWNNDGYSALLYGNFIIMSSVFNWLKLNLSLF